MQQTTSKQLYAYWDRVRNGRLAPRRFEIEPAKVAPLLPETFIAECEGLFSYRFRLAGTRICEHFGKELRGEDLLQFWTAEDRHGLTSLLRHVVCDAAACHVLFSAHNEERREARFELVVMPLIHAGGAINRLLGAITAIDPPFWLGSRPLVAFTMADMHLIWPDGEPRPQTFPSPPARSEDAGGRKRFRVYPGGAG